MMERVVDGDVKGSWECELSVRCLYILWWWRNQFIPSMTYAACYAKAALVCGERKLRNLGLRGGSGLEWNGRGHWDGCMELFIACWFIYWRTRCCVDIYIYMYMYMCICNCIYPDLLQPCFNEI